jgi:hypothetical protein
MPIICWDLIHVQDWQPLTLSLLCHPAAGQPAAAPPGQRRAPAAEAVRLRAVQGRGGGRRQLLLRHPGIHGARGAPRFPPFAADHPLSLVFRSGSNASTTAESLSCSDAPPPAAARALLHLQHVLMWTALLIRAGAHGQHAVPRHSHRRVERRRDAVHAVRRPVPGACLALESPVCALCLH